jgi:putative ATP-binding cassette transporter
MNTQEHRRVWTRLGEVVREFLRSEARWGAMGLAAMLLASLLGIIGLNVVNSYIGKNFMSALAERQASAFQWFAVLYLAVFAASAAVAALERFLEERLALNWREWLTGRILDAYMDRRAYLHLQERGAVLNPDQRIAEDLRGFSATVLSFCILLFNGTLTAVSFSVVLWSISPTLLAVCFGYAAVGSAVTLLLGRPLIGLNYRQLDREADFRSSLIHVRENAAAIAQTAGEGRTRRTLGDKFAALADNTRAIIRVNLGLNFATNGYNYLPQILPVLIICPLYMRGAVEFGVVSQATIAFGQLVGALSLLVTQCQAISSFTAAVVRLSELTDAIDKCRQDPPAAVATST